MTQEGKRLGVGISLSERLRAAGLLAEIEERAKSLPELPREVPSVDRFLLDVTRTLSSLGAVGAAETKSACGQYVEAFAESVGEAGQGPQCLAVRLEPMSGLPYSFVSGLELVLSGPCGITAVPLPRHPRRLRTGRDGQVTFEDLDAGTYRLVLGPASRPGVPVLQRPARSVTPAQKRRHSARTEEPLGAIRTRGSSRPRGSAPTRGADRPVVLAAAEVAQDRKPRRWEGVSEQGIRWQLVEGPSGRLSLFLEVEARGGMDVEYALCDPVTGEEVRRGRVCLEVPLTGLHAPGLVSGSTSLDPVEPLEEGYRLCFSMAPVG